MAEHHQRLANKRRELIVNCLFLHNSTTEMKKAFRKKIYMFSTKDDIKVFF